VKEMGYKGVNYIQQAKSSGLREGGGGLFLIYWNTQTEEGCVPSRSLTQKMAVPNIEGLFCVAVDCLNATVCLG
jgi:hypothetical protein